MMRQTCGWILPRIDSEVPRARGTRVGHGVVLRLLGIRDTRTIIVRVGHPILVGIVRRSNVFSFFADSARR